jgi:hypothetical protein
MEDVQRSIAAGEAAFQSALKRCRITGIPDTVEELSSWYSFQEPDPEPEVRRSLLADRELDPAVPVSRELDETWIPTEPIRYTGPRVGRNDPCPCGSGRKFKKCCGRS